MESSAIEFYESTFVKFMMEEIVISHLREYNPSMIVLSYSGKINIDNDYFVEMVKQLAVISNFRLLFYVNHAKMFCFDEKGPEVAAGEDFFNEEHDYYHLYENAKIIVFHHHSRMNTGTHIQDISPTTLNLDFMDKLSIFLKVSSGTYTLSRAVEEDSYI